VSEFIAPPSPAAVLLLVASPAEQLQIVPVKRDAWIVDIGRRQFDFMMYLLARRDQPTGKASLAEQALALCIRLPALDPLGRNVKSIRKAIAVIVSLCVHVHIKKRPQR